MQPHLALNELDPLRTTKEAPNRSASKVTRHIPEPRLSKGASQPGLCHSALAWGLGRVAPGILRPREAIMQKQTESGNRCGSGSWFVSPLPGRAVPVTGCPLLGRDRSEQR